MNNLEETVELMLSNDYKDRFKAEYWQTKIRWQKLDSMLFKYRNGELDFEPSCPIYILEWQRDIMHVYMKILEQRAEIEGID
jgi:hypothetical protein